MIRGLAVAMVLFSHFLGWSYPAADLSPEGNLAAPSRQLLLLSMRPGWIGVQLFFVLSGLLITGILLDTKEQMDFVPRFYARRIARIQPALLVTLLLIGILHWTGVPFSHLEDVTWAGLAMALLFSANLGPLIGIPNPYGPLWSLAIEEQFYLGWPFLVRSLPLRWLKGVCLFGIAGGPILRVIGYQFGDGESLNYVTWFALDGLFAGSLLACLLRQRRWATRTGAGPLAVGLFVCGVSLILLQVLLGSMSRKSMIGASLGPLPWVLLSASLITGILIAGSEPRWRRMTEIGILQDFGFISYGLYLLHPIVMILCDHFLSGITYAAPNANPRLVDMLWRLLVLTVLSYYTARWSRTRFEEWFLKRREIFEAGLLRLLRCSRRKRSLQSI